MSKIDLQIKKVLREMSEEPEYGRLDRSLVQDVIDRLLSDETGGYKGALKALNSEFSTGQYSRPERTYEPLKPGIRVGKSIY
ncbi:hypothetical protein UFOVP117_345 [uncultured Caudovirales phage]|uniref:Uncharacterized protein n=1 Tax=uncultured Caudovirales phage TaxID=2100421 RepID=A0A6J5LBL9_9CAUD|nr:hypothetical protein UFOVP117_345 [uncultured Caudovirales phage]